MGKLDAMKKAAAGVPVRKTAAPVNEKKHQYGDIRLDDIALNPKNDYALKDTEEDIRQLAESIRRQGMDHNIVISRHADGTLLLLSGERRLKATKLLRADEKLNATGKYDRIHAKIYDGLDETEEEIILDETNLEVRGSLDDPETQRKTMARYVTNLQKKYGLSQTEAQRMLAQVSNASEATIYRNMKLSFSLVPELQEFLADDRVRRSDILAFCGLDEDDQRTIAQAIQQAHAYFYERGNTGRFQRDAVLRNCVDAANSWIEGDEPLKLEDLTIPLHVNLTPIKSGGVMQDAALSRKAKYVGKYNKLAAELAKTAASKATVKGMRKLEQLEGEGSIRESLEALIREAQGLLDQLEE